MKRTRREFMKEAALVGVVVASGTGMSESKAGNPSNDTGAPKKCPYFDQPMMCGGPDESGKFRCDA
jgi:hypothetical protein